MGSFGVGEHMEVLGGWWAWKGEGGSMSLPHTFLCASLPAGCSSVSLIMLFYNKLINVSKLFFLSFVSCSRKLIKPEYGGGGDWSLEPLL